MRWKVLIPLLLALGCTEERYYEEVIPGSVYIESRGTFPSYYLKRGDTVVESGRLKGFYKSKYYTNTAEGEVVVYLPTGSGCARVDRDIKGECGVVMVPDTPSTRAGCPSCDTTEESRSSIIEVLTWEKPVAVTKGGKCLEINSLEYVSAAYIDSVPPGKYTLIAGGDTLMFYVSSKECRRITLGGGG